MVRGVDDQLVADPFAEIQRLCAFLDIDWDDELANRSRIAPHARLAAPRQVAPQRRRARAVVATVVAAGDTCSRCSRRAPRTDPVPIDDSADRRPVRRRANPPVAEATVSAGSAETSDSAETPPKEEPSEQELFGSQHSGSFRALLQGVGARSSPPPTRPDAS